MLLLAPFQALERLIENHMLTSEEGVNLWLRSHFWFLFDNEANSWYLNSNLHLCCLLEYFRYHQALWNHPPNGPMCLVFPYIISKQLWCLLQWIEYGVFVWSIKKMTNLFCRYIPKTILLSSLKFVLALTNYFLPLLCSMIKKML